MEKNNNIGGGGQQQQRVYLPPGVFFLPTDEELLTIYLRNEAAGEPAPRGLPIPTHDFYVAGADPWVVQREVFFPYTKDGEIYCYTHRSPGAIRATGSGTWTAKGEEVAVRAAHTEELVGHKLVLEFVPEGGGGGGERSNWVMHEYRLPDSRGGGCRPTTSSSSSNLFQELVLCRIYQITNAASRRRASRNNPPRRNPPRRKSSVTSLT